MKSAGPLQDRVALVTGAGGEIGAAIAAVLATMGAAVVVNHRDGTDRAAAELTAESVRMAGAKVAVIAADIGDSVDAHRLFETAWNGFGRLDDVPTAPPRYTR
ncbi:SDR family NAD(P)-dependent oxidoreductase [Nocardia sp. NPDC088792]|uniref:SDR family NAD(P)-dependent oxidoreductase n=1 Tax=Nocardia sp. NPDC088792 TaxID=3364332 RepID=UPI003808ED03